MRVLQFIFSTKKAIIAVLIIIVFLIAQAYSDLSLPRYTSDIVDIGIMQGGIENAVPNQIRESSMDDLKLFMDEADAVFVDANYKRTDVGILELAIPRSDTETIEALNGIFEIPMLLNAGSALQAAGADAAEETVSSPAANFDLEQVKAAYAAGYMTKDQLMDIRQKAEEYVNNLGSLMTETVAVAFVRGEYQALGLDMNKIQMDYMVATGIKMIGFTLASVAAAIIVGYLASRTAAGVSRSLRRRSFEKVLSFSNAEMDKFSVASLITRSTNDIQHIQMATVMLLRMVLFAPIMGIGGIIMVTRTRTGMGWIVVIAVAVLLFVISFLMMFTMPKFRILQKLIDKLNLVSREILTGLPVIRAFCREDFEEKRFEGANRDLMKTQLFTNRAMSMMFPFMMLTMNVISVVIVWFGAKYIDVGNLQVGDMMAFITYTIQIVMSFMMLSIIAVMLPRANVAAGRVHEVLTTEASILDKPVELQIDREEWEGKISFNNVNFRFPDAVEDVLEDITFTAEPGQTTAIIGSTGSGKSTVINLIPRLFDVTGGSITIDGVDIRDMSQHKLRSLIGAVPQKGILFSGDIRSNLKFGTSHATDDTIYKAAEIAQALEFIEEKEDKFESPISQGGSNVSGGQKQRLSIARAITKDPKIFIFDDSFSALDYKTDTALRRALFEHLGYTTVIIVAQRISTILHADKIIVLDEGKIAGIGTHKTLLQTCEVYREIAESQLSEKELSA